MVQRYTCFLPDKGEYLCPHLSLIWTSSKKEAVGGIQSLNRKERASHFNLDLTMPVASKLQFLGNFIIKLFSKIFPSFRPSQPAPCRKRPLCQGQALRVACANLDMHGRASGIKYTRAMDGNASDGGSGHKHQIEMQNAKSRKAKYIKSFS